MAIPVQPFKWIGGALCLDFNNTVDWHHLEPAENDLLVDLERVAAWGKEAGVLSPGDQRRLVSAGKAESVDGERAMASVRAARRTVHGIFYALARGDKPELESLRDLNRFLARSPAQVVAAGGARRFRWSWPPEPNAATPVVWPALWSASQLLTASQLIQLKTCANETCGWLFVDVSRKHNRRWCEMGVCGNRAKVRRFYQRRKAEGRA